MLELQGNLEYRASILTGHVLKQYKLICIALHWRYRGHLLVARNLKEMAM